jgi:hypothetical protein
MNITREEAQASLGMIEETRDRTVRQLQYRGASQLLVIWGLVWIVGFLGTQYYPRVDEWIWLVVDVIGIALTAVICTKTFGQVRSEAGSRIGWFWGVLFVYAYLYMGILGPVDGTQVAAFIATHVMFAYVVMGLWLKSNAMIWLGGSITVMTAIGFFALQPYFGLWMAVTGGGVLLVSGLYMGRMANR